MEIKDEYGRVVKRIREGVGYEEEESNEGNNSSFHTTSGVRLLVMKNCTMIAQNRMVFQRFSL